MDLVIVRIQMVQHSSCFGAGPGPGQQGLGHNSSIKLSMWTYDIVYSHSFHKDIYPIVYFHGTEYLEKQYYLL